MGYKNPPLVSFISLALALALTPACLFGPARSQEVYTMISPEEMRKPLRAIAITFSSRDQNEVIHQLRLRAYQAGFASRISSDPVHTGDLFLQLYRRDMKLIGYLPAGSQTLKFNLYRNNGLPESASMIDFILTNFREAASVVASADFRQTVFLAGDDFSHYSGRGAGPQLNGQIAIPTQQVMPLTDALAHFAEAHQMAIRFQQWAPDRRQFYVDMYREELMISGINDISADPMSIAIYKTGDRTVSAETIATTFAELKQAVEAVPGVTFTLKK